MRKYIAHYCLITEDGGYQVALFEAENFLTAAGIAIDRTPQLMQLYSIEMEPLPKPRRRKFRDLPFKSAQDN